MSALAWSVLLSLASAVAYAAGAVAQERVAATTGAPRFAPVRQRRWWVAVGLHGVGALLHVAALSYGPLSVVQPLGALTIVLALPMSRLFAGARADAGAWRGCATATLGLVGLLALVDGTGTRAPAAAERAGTAAVTVCAVLTLMITARALRGRPAARSMVLALAAGVAFGIASVFTKTVTVGWSEGITATGLASLTVIGVLATSGVLLSQAAYRGAGLAAPLATLTVANPVVASAVGVASFGEGFRHGAQGATLAVVSGLVAAGGLASLTARRRSADESHAEVPGPGGGPRSREATSNARTTAPTTVRQPCRRPAPLATPPAQRGPARSAGSGAPPRAPRPDRARSNRPPHTAPVPPASHREGVRS
ncbi:MULTISPECIES: DMT family transporter [unclassified Streptomyces]|uniref:DMT family transporter n=1 Tax=unclassified Streptomyces TaxID=2593676 RepID=UPI0019078B2C|nr:DMT family transporter [Streptomyces sp. HSG2]